MQIFEARKYVVAVVLLENVGPHNDTRFKHLRLASGQGIQRGGPSVRVQRGGEGPCYGPSGSKKGPLGYLLRSFRASVTVRVGPCTARGSCGWSKWCGIIHRQGLERPRRELRKTQGLSTSEGPSGSFGVPQSRGVESLIRGSFKWSWLAPSTSQGMTLLTEILV